MKHLLWLLAVLGVAVSPASAGPNVGGVLWVHDTGIVYSSDLAQPVVSAPPADCAGVDNQQPLDGVKRVWKVYAAFPPGSSPRLKSAAWGIQFPESPSDPYVSIEHAGCGLPNEDGPNTDFAIEDHGFPASSGGEIGQSFPNARLTTVVELYYFTGFGLAYPGARLPDSFQTVPHSAPSDRFFLDDATPQSADMIVGYGSLGFGRAGTTPCPTTDFTAACCTPEGLCTLTTHSDCPLSAIWHSEWISCLPNPCPPATGACCYTDGTCVVTPCDPPVPGDPCPGGMTAQRCEYTGGTYQGDLVECYPNPCPPRAPCCVQGTHCNELTEADCAACYPPGVWHPEWASCNNNPCLQLSTAACCTPTGSCAVTTQAACPSPDIWHEEWASCTPNPCPPHVPSACCAPTGACTVTMEQDCPAPNVWHSTWPTCDPGPCLGPGEGSIMGWGAQVVVEPSALEGIGAVAAGGYHSVGLKSDRTIVAWGQNSRGQCDVPSPNAGFTSVAGGWYHSLGLKADRTLVAWGDNGYGQCNVPSPNADFVAAAAGTFHNLGVKSGGTIVAWGWNEFGQCDIPSPNAGFVAVAAGEMHSLGLKSDGTIVAWGWNRYGQCDVPSPNAGFVAVAAGDIHSLGLRSDGSIVAWGANDEGQCDVPSPNAGFMVIAGGGRHSLGLKSDGSIAAWGKNDSGECTVPAPNAGFVAIAGGGSHTLALGSDHKLVAWGDNSCGQCNIPAPGAGFVAVAGGFAHSLGLRSDRTIAAWGQNSAGQCAVPAPNDDFVAVAVGEEHSLGLKSEGSIVAWGWNGYGCCTVPLPNANFVAIAASGYHSLGLKSDRTIVAWGENTYGQCDVPAPNADFVAVAAGEMHSLGLKSDGTIVAWGVDDSGQCDIPAPNAGFVAVAGSLEHSLGLKSDGTIVAWGAYSAGQCDVPSPNADFVAIAAGRFYSLGLKSDRSIVAWGYNEYGACNVPSPDTGFVAIASGYFHCLGLRGATSVSGACCTPAGDCTLTLQPDCASPSSWQGAGTSCTPNPCSPTPVLLESWAASSRTEGLQLRWEVPLGTTGARYRAWRDAAAGPHDAAPTPEAVLVSSAWSTASAEGMIEIIDANAPRGATARYFLEVSVNGYRGEFFGPVEARWDPPPLVWTAGPTPFRGRVQLTAPGIGPARAQIFDPAGRLVRTLERSGGSVPLVWNGRDDSGRDAPTGVYLVRLTSEFGDAVKRLVKIQ